MGFGGISLWQLLIVLVIVLLLFGTSKLKGMGSDLGGAIKGFKKAIDDDDEAAPATQAKVEASTVDKDKAGNTAAKTSATTKTE